MYVSQLGGKSSLRSDGVSETLIIFFFIFRGTDTAEPNNTDQPAEHAAMDTEQTDAEPSDIRPARANQLYTTTATAYRPKSIVHTELRLSKRAANVRPKPPRTDQTSTDDAEHGAQHANTASNADKHWPNTKP